MGWAGGECGGVELVGGVMRIVICKDCKYICKPAGALYEPHPESTCLHPMTDHLNFVTGEKDRSLCKEINYNGDCEYWEGKC